MRGFGLRVPPGSGATHTQRRGHRSIVWVGESPTRWSPASATSCSASWWRARSAPRASARSASPSSPTPSSSVAPAGSPPTRSWCGSAARTPAWRRAVSASSATALTSGWRGAGCMVVGLALPGSLGLTFIALGVGFPPLLLQDSWRFAFFAAGRPAQALLNDLVWGGACWRRSWLLLVTGSPPSPASPPSERPPPWRPASAISRQDLPGPQKVGSWLFDHTLAGRSLRRERRRRRSRQIRFIVLGALAGLATVGVVRGAELLMGPFLVMLMGVSQVAVPEASHVMARAPPRSARSAPLGAALAVAAGVGLPHRGPPGHGAGQPAARADLAPGRSAVARRDDQLFMAGFEDGASAGVRALGASRRSLAAQRHLRRRLRRRRHGGGPRRRRGRSCWGVALATTLGALVWWYHLRRAIAEHLLVLDAAPDAATRPRLVSP